MKAYFDKETGELRAVTAMPTQAPANTTGLPVQPDGELCRRMGENLSRFRLNSEGKIEELVGWEPVDMTAEEQWVAGQLLLVEYTQRMAGAYDVKDKETEELIASVPFSAAKLLGDLLNLAPSMIRKGDGARPPGPTAPPP